MNLQKLRDNIVEGFNLAELREICFDLNIQYENLGGTTLSEKTIELVEFCKRRGQLSNLVEECQKLRPKISWQEVFNNDEETTIPDNDETPELDDEKIPEPDDEEIQEPDDMNELLDKSGWIAGVLSLISTLFAIDTFGFRRRWVDSNNFLKRLIINRWFQSVLALLFFIVFISAYFSLQTQVEAFHGVEPEVIEVTRQVITVPKITEVIVPIDSAMDWQSTGLIVSAGEEYAISVSGKWTTSRVVISHTELITTAYNNYVILRDWGEVGEDGYTDRSCGASNCPLANSVLGVLLGKIENGDPFVIGSDPIFQALNDGELFLRVNDSDFSDNHGILAVEISKSS